MTYAIESVSGLLRELRLMTVGKSRSPHKYLFLLALAKLYERNPERPNAFPLDSLLESAFSEVCRSVYPNSAPQELLIEYPYYHLTTDQVWRLILLPGKQETFRHYAEADNMRMTKARLVETVSHAVLADELDACLRDSDGRGLFVAQVNALLSAIPDHHVRREPNTGNELARLELLGAGPGNANPFVSYLNSLQRLNASNENALAEFQACHPMFALIHVPHPLIQVVVDELRQPQGRQVILTGHAGDGKSTIALAAYKALAGLPPDQPLSRQLQPREDLKGTTISIVKDLSERRRTDDPHLAAELKSGKRRFLLVSNTGTLLDFFAGQAGLWGVSRLQLESDVLTAISDEQGKAELLLGNTRFLVLNLARMDNLDVARRIFERMIDPARWQTCASRNCAAACPIHLNVGLINARREIVLDRLFLAYRRMYEYGTRLTLRQITEHLAYMITSGLEESDLARMRQRGDTPLKAEFMFFNRFFGDNGHAPHPAAEQMQAVREIRRQGFGERPCPTWERRLWLRLKDQSFHLNVQQCEAEFEVLRNHGSGPGNSSQPGLTPDQAREQVRRMLYFLYAFAADDHAYLVQFLNSPTVLRWQSWQQPGAALGMTERHALEQRIHHVLQEHFTGVRMPEGTRGQDRRLYITLNRGRSEIRQSAQVVVAQVDWSSEMNLALLQQADAAGAVRTDLVLRGAGRMNGAELKLSLPFLDYVLMRHVGEVGETLQPAYVERLERFKAQIQDLARQSSAHVMLVRLRTDHTFKRQQYAVSNGKLEVNDVL